MEEKVEEKVSILKQEWFVILMVVFVAPFGIFLIWKNKMFPTYARVILSIIFGIIFLFFLIFLRGVCITLNENPLVGEWEYDTLKNKTVENTSNFKFEKNGEFKWLVLNKNLDGNVLIEETYTLTPSVVSLMSPDTATLELNYFIQGDTLVLDGIYYKKGKNLNYTPGVTNVVATPAEEEPVEVVAPEPVSVDLSAGMYIVGEDVPPGKYDITAISGSGNFFGKPGIVTEMMGTDDSEYYIPSYNNAIFKNGNTIEIKGTLVVNLTSK